MSNALLPPAGKAETRLNRSVRLPFQVWPLDGSKYLRLIALTTTTDAISTTTLTNRR